MASKGLQQKECTTVASWRLYLVGALYLVATTLGSGVLDSLQHLVHGRTVISRHPIFSYSLQIH